MNNLLKKIGILSLLMIFGNVLLGQVGLTLDNSSAAPQEEELFQKQSKSNVFFSPKNNQSKLPQDLRNYFLSDSNSQNANGLSFLKNNKTELAFFCRIEVGLEKSSKLPVRFRLGEVQAVDKKEGKWKQFNSY